MKEHLKKLEGVKGITDAIHKLEKRLRHIQDTCEHSRVKKIHHSGDRDNNVYYWTDFHCLECGKNWSEDGTK